MLTLATSALLLGASTALLLLALRGRGSQPPRFPGPRSFPNILGNILPSERVWVALTSLAAKYGPIYSLRFFRTRVLVVSSAVTARDLFEHRSAKYANRPLPKMVEMSGFHRGVALEHDLERLRQGRRVIRSAMQPRELETYDGQVQHYLALYLKNMLDSPDAFEQHTKVLLAGITIEISHGYEISGPDDAVLVESRKLVENFNKASYAKGHLVDWLPFLSVLPAWLPGMGFKNTAQSWQTHYEATSRAIYEWAKGEILRGTARPSMVEYGVSEKMAEDIVMYSAVQVYTGGSETTASAVCSFILMMVLHPEVQRRAQAEIDSVIGRDRLPTFADRKRLPYVNAVLCEVLRILPPITATLREPGGDDVYNGHLITNGTMIIQNFWGMLHDPAAFPDPGTFQPERWLHADATDIHYPLNIVFGYGRRACPGRLLAERVGFTAVALLLSLFQISPAYDDKGEPIMPVPEQTTGSISAPLPFRCVIEPRNDHARLQVEEFYAAHR